MTEEQKKLVEDNYGLLLDFLSKKKLPINESDKFNGIDWYGTAAIGFCNAAAAYDPTKDVAFSTFAYQCMTNAIANCYTTLNRQSRIPSDMICSLDYILTGNDAYEERDIALLDRLPDSKEFENEVIFNTLYEKALIKLSERDRNIIEMLRDEVPQYEIAEKMGISRGWIWLVKEKFKKLVFGKEEIIIGS